MVDRRHTLLLHAEDIDHVTARLLAHRDHVVGGTCRGPVLAAVEQAVDGLVVLRVADEGQVVDRHHRPDTLGAV